MKKWIIALIVVLLVAGGIVGIMLSRSGSSSTPSPTTAIQIPDGPKIKIVFNGPPELKAAWDDIKLVSYQIQLKGRITNTSDVNVSFKEIAFLFDGNQVAFIPGQTLAPGMIMEILKGFPGYDENTKVLEVRVVGFKKDTLTPTTTTTTTPPPTTSTQGMEPGRVVEKFFYLCKDGKFEEAMELLGPETRKEIESMGGANYLKQKWQKDPGDKITITGVIYETGSNPPHANVYNKVLYADKTTGEGKTSLYEINGEWKIGE